LESLFGISQGFEDAFGRSFDRNFLDAGLRGFIKLIQSRIHDSFEHRQEASFDSVPKRLLFAIL
jgi:hypothetical protein